MSDVAAFRYPTPPTVRAANIVAKGSLLLLLAAALLFPDTGNLRDKGAGVRAVAYPLLSFSVVVTWAMLWKNRASFPWGADLLVTVTCFTDILGNRLDLYDSIAWFDDWMHFQNTALLTAAVVLLTMHRMRSLGAVLERSLAFGATAALVWEVGEFFAFIRFSPERTNAYVDTLSDMALGTVGALVAGLVIWAMWQRGRLMSTAPQLDRQLEPLRRR